MGVWEYGSMVVWEYGSIVGVWDGSMGWEYGSMVVWERDYCETIAMKDSTTKT